jgi:replication factor C small subunit
MLCHVLKEISGYEKSSGGFKTVVIDNASEMRTDFQQALRRIIENNHETTQFIIITRSNSEVIAAIQSRCTPVPLRNPTTDECVNVITTMLEEEDVEYTIDGVEFLVGASEHDIREAVLTAQTVAEQTGELTQQNVFDTCSEIGYEITIDDIVVAADAGELKDARDDLDELLVDEGVSGDEVLHMISETVHNKFTDEKKLELVSAVSETDVLLSEGDNERVHLMKLLGEIASC